MSTDHGYPETSSGNAGDSELHQAIQEILSCTNKLSEELTRSHEEEAGAVQRLNLRIDRIEQRLSEVLDRMSTSNDPNDALFSDVEESPRDRGNHPILEGWEKKRAELLGEGDSPEEKREPVAESPMVTAPLQPPIRSQPNIDISVETLMQMGAAQDDIDEILMIKESLQAKLRETEVQLSIERSKVTQLWSALEERSAQLEKRERELDRKSQETRPSLARNAFRLKNFLGGKSESDD